MIAIKYSRAYGGAIESLPDYLGHGADSVQQGGAAIGLILSGCISSREISFPMRTSVPTGSTIDVTTPADGVYVDEEYPKA
jgi:hypothetical protein